MADAGRLVGQRALVTGGGRGIGAAIVRRLAADGADVAINYVADAASAEALLGELIGHPEPVTFKLPARSDFSC